jgi:hypothetical protein
MENIALAALPREKGFDSEPDSDLELSVDEQILDDGNFAALNGGVAGRSLLQASGTTKESASVSSTSSLSSIDLQILGDRESSVPPPHLIAKIGGLERLGLNLGGAPPRFVSPYATANNFSATTYPAIVETHTRNQRHPFAAPPKPGLKKYTPRPPEIFVGGFSGPSVVGMENMPQPAPRPRGPNLKFTREDDQ